MGGRLIVYRPFLCYTVEMEPKNWKDKTLNHHAFDDFSDPETAYWAGMLAADGWIASRMGGNRLVGLSLTGEDGWHVNSFTRFLNSSLVPGQYKTASGSVAHRITISSERIGSKLVSAGITPKKTKFLRITNDTLLSSRDFWRGAVDGDGCLGIYMPSITPREEFPSISLCGTVDLCDGFSSFIEANLGFRVLPKKQVKFRYEPGLWLWAVRAAHRKGLAVMKLLYSNCVVAMPRKLNIALEAIDRFDGLPATCKQSPCKMKTRMTPRLMWQIQQMKLAGERERIIAEKLDITMGQVAHPIRKVRTLSVEDVGKLELDYSRYISSYMKYRQ